MEVGDHIMKTYKDTHAFYRSDDWQTFRQQVISDNISRHAGILTCDRCNRPIHGIKKVHVHHIQELNNQNVNNPVVSLNPSNTAVLCHDCHNLEHNRYCASSSVSVYLVYGSPCSGKIDYVKQRAGKSDLIISADLISEAITNRNLYDTSEAVSGAVQAMKRLLLDMVKKRAGKYAKVWVIDSMPSKAKRAEFYRIFGAQGILVPSTEEECRKRRREEKRPPEFDGYIERWFQEYKPD